MLMPHRIRWTPRYTEATGFLVLAVGVGIVWLPGALIIGGVYLILGAYVRGGNA